MPSPDWIQSPAQQITAFLVSGAGNSVVVLDTSSLSAATANRAAVQSAISLGGLVRLAGRGVAYIDQALVIGSNTKLSVDPNLEIKLTGGTVQNMLVTSAYQRALAGYNAATLTWTAGRSVQVNKVAHGLTAGQYVFMYSTTLAPSHFIGCFPVIGVVSADAFTIQLHRTPPTSPAGTVQYVLADQNITVEGGIWNQDFPTNGGGTSLTQHAMVMGACANVRVQNMRFRNVAKFCVLFGGCYDYGADGIAAMISNSDIIKVYGPAVNGFARSISGYTADDIVSLQGKEAAAYISFAWTWGDIHNFAADNLAATTSGSNVFTVYGSVNEYMGGIFLRNASGSAGNNGVTVAAGYANAVIDDVTVENGASGAVNALRVSANSFSGLVVNRLEVRGFKPQFDTYASARTGILLDANTTVNEFTMLGMDVNDSAWPTAFAYMAALNGTVGTFNLIGGRFNGGSGNANGFQLVGAVTNININGVSIGSNCGTFVQIQAGTPTVHVSGCDVNSFGFLGTYVATTFVLNGNRFNVNSNGVLRSNAAVAIAVKAAGNNYVAGALFTNGVTATWSFYGFDLALDVGGTGVNKTNGAFCMNIGLSRGTLTQNRLVTCNGTNWVQVDTPANVF